MEKLNVQYWDDKSRSFKTAIFVCKKSKFIHKKLKKYANNETYWFNGLTGQNWYRGGFWDYNHGFINAMHDLKNNVQGVVLNNEVLILKKIIL